LGLQMNWAAEPLAFTWPVFGAFGGGFAHCMIEYAIYPIDKLFTGNMAFQ